MNKNILNALKGNDLVIVVGSDLSMLRFPKKEFPDFKQLLKTIDSAVEDGDAIKINVNDYIAHKIWTDFHEQTALPSPFSLNTVVEVLVGEGETTEDDIKAIIMRVVDGLTDDQIELEPFQKLAKISSIETILSVNFDNFLERAFEAEDRKLNPSINFSIQDSNPADGKLEYDKAIPRIFNLMGNIKASDFAITEEMQLEYLYKLLMGKDKDANSKALFNAVNNKSILFIGCSFPNWYMRFFIRTVAKKRYKTGRSKFVASDKTAQDIKLSLFLENNQTSVIPIGKPAIPVKDNETVYCDTVEFIDELFAKTTKEEQILVDNKPRFKEKIFLSYSWGDKPLIKKLKNEFEKNGVELFFDDDDLRNGENFANSISNYINTCDYILPLISENSISRKESYVYEKEWTQAIYVEQFKQSSNLFPEGQENYIRPYVIDKTLETDDRIPEEIRKRNITRIESEENFGEMVRKFIKENKLTEI